MRVEDSVGGDFTFTYDLVGRTTSAASPFGTVQYGYDPLGRVTTRQVVGQPPVDYDYDPVGNLLKAAMPQATVDFSYDARDQLLDITRSNGVATTYEYDPIGRVLSLTHAKDATVLNTQTYEYDAVGNRTSYATNIAQLLITQPVSNSYDNGNRLTQSGAKTFAYDDNGNLTSETGLEGTTTYSWDARNRLASLTTPDGQTISFLYDFAGNLIRKSVSGANPSSQEFVLDEITNIAYQKNSDSSQLDILTGKSIDTHLAVVGSGGQTNFGLTDTINSTTATTDQNGSSSSQFFYEPFGQTTASGGNYPFQFTGRVPITGSLYYYRARFYNPIAGRFISEDLIGFNGGDVNLYRYVFNNFTKIDRSNWERSASSGRDSCHILNLHPEVCERLCGLIDCVVELLGNKTDPSITSLKDLGQEGVERLCQEIVEVFTADYNNCSLRPLRDPCAGLTPQECVAGLTGNPTGFFFQ